jgi:hypothetical protein
MPEGMDYSDAVHLCLRLYCTVDGVPQSLLPLSKETLSDAFSQLGSTGWVRGCDADEVSAPSHWIGVIGAIFKKGSDVVDIGRGQRLACEVGFVTEREAV